VRRWGGSFLIRETKRAKINNIGRGLGLDPDHGIFIDNHRD
jgi:hypothetical protein